MHQPLPPSPYFASITFLQRASLSVPYLHNCLPNKAKLSRPSRQIPKPPFFIGIQTLAHSIRGILGASIPLQRKSLCSFSIRLATFTRTGQRERKKVGKLDKVLLIRVTLPPLDKYIIFHPVKRFSIFSKIGFQIVSFLRVASNGRPKHFKGSEGYLQPKISTNSSIVGTIPIGTNFDFNKLIKTTLD